MVVVPLIVDVSAAFVVTPLTVMVSLTTLDFVTGSGVILRPTSSVMTDVAVEVASGEIIEVVAVTFSVVILRTSDGVIETVSVLFNRVVDVASEAAIVVLAVNFATNVVVV